MDVKASTVKYLSHLSSRGIKSVSKSRTDKTSATKTPDVGIKKAPNVGNMVGDSLFVDNLKFNNLEEVKSHIGNCQRCRLGETRTKIVFGEGNPNAKIMFVGEGPGQDEDESGRPFVGRAGQLLTKIIEAMGVKREDVYIANIVKCRPPGNRTPADDEIMHCAPFLMHQISTIKPKVIVALGSPATCTLLNEKIKISAIRGTFYEWKDGVKLMPTFHPAYLLRNPNDKKLVWEDIQKVMDYLKLR